MNSIEMKSKNFEKPEKIIVTLHGYGTSGEDFAEVGELLLVNEIDNAVFAYPDAPHKCSNPYFGTKGFIWFPLEREITKDDVRNGLDSSAPILAEYLENLKEKYQCNELVVMGFSQGAMLAFETMYYTNVSKIVAFSGLFERNLKKSIISRPDILIIHSNDDDVVPFKNAAESVKSLEELGFKPRIFVEYDRGHTISEGGWEAAINFVKKNGN